MENIIIAVDGPAASGKGTIARRLAEALHLAYMDTGTIYRAAAKRILDQGRNPSDPEAAVEAAIYLRDHFSWESLDDNALRTDEIANATSKSCIFPAMREILVHMQRQFAQHPPFKPGHKAYNGAILDGRDIGTVICPDANVKLFVTANVEVRALRRTKELTSRGLEADYTAVLQDLIDRDARDSGRSVAPLKASSDAIFIDTSLLSADEAFDKALGAVRSKLA